MPAERVSMRRVREMLHLKYAAGASDRAIARAVGVARSTVRLCLEALAVLLAADAAGDAATTKVLQRRPHAVDVMYRLRGHVDAAEVLHHARARAGRVARRAP